ncbi:apolipoprotein L3-like [Mastomys coucha]|uniref:apolipoprotein L3-like n=1 Tax=Mastomys coucha TaxID=35658 RepID=UPI00126154ED|nr:apolipoprotein L3-like [Mastomys coucha]
MSKIYFFHRCINFFYHNFCLRLSLPDVEDLKDFLLETIIKTDLIRLIADDEPWELFVETTELSSEEGAALRDALKEHLAGEPTDENDGPQREQQKELFLRDFPPLKEKLEDNIRKLRELADHIDQVHEGCSISNEMSSFIVAASGLLGLLGLTLAPLTEGGSLALSAASLGLGATAGVTGLTTTIVEDSMRGSDESQGRRLLDASMNILEEILEIMPKNRVKIFNPGVELADALKTLKDQIPAFNTDRFFSGLGRQTRNFISTGRSALSVTRGAAPSFFLAWDVHDLVNESKDLYDGAKTESARALRVLAHKLEEKLQEFEQNYKALQSDLPQ